MIISLVRQGNKIGFINHRNEVVIELDDFDDIYAEYSNEWGCSENIVSLAKENRYAFYKVGQGQITPHRYWYIDDDFRDGLAIVTNNNYLYCVVDTQGNHRLKDYTSITRVYNPDKKWFLVRHKRQNDDIGSNEKYRYSLRDEFDNLIILYDEEMDCIDKYRSIDFYYTAPYLYRRNKDKLALYDILGKQITGYNYDELVWNDIRKVCIYKKYYNHKYDKVAENKEDVSMMEVGILNLDGTEFCLIKTPIDNNKNNGKSYADIEYLMKDVDMVIIKKDRKLGLIDYQGKVVLPTIYDRIYFNGYIKIPSTEVFFVKNENWLLINRCGEVLTNFDNDYDYIDSIKNSYIVFEKNKKYGVVDFNNTKIVDFVYDNINFINFANLAIAQNYQGNEGQKKCVEVDIIDLTTKRVIATFQDVDYYGVDNEHSIIAVYNGYKWGFFDLATRNLIILFLYHKTDVFHLGLCPVSQINEQGQEKWGAINANNETVIPFIYDDMRGFFDSYTGFV
ncbi:WG repeat-containing protein [Psychrobacter sp. I-STPA10]|uniref:WG repeat-containing protein n=1 Tax=Psychrobacter sp. I-STPA10 TaxID=2585769 RepID=UPI001E60EBD9|nr:WG repeat-containing protein [Psychrobacter sp. I-STPA10]